MPLRTDDCWHYEGDAATREKRVYRDEALIGRVRRWHMVEPDGRYCAWFATEQWQGGRFHSVGELQATFDEALICLVSCLVPMAGPAPKPWQ
ncbi:conserved hypothetical protein [Methylobacterium nodulans ORS 2060]|uniref:Uncharacterized protein n=2 Tax=Methylobacterium nodulans TaxID=114616 RepID=B8IMH4_METNO|nr:conserved hypothetical protein [Methylobacterium nodulans ORS 2060]